MKVFKWIVGLSALIIASCAAYFSVTGIALLFSGSIIGVAIMAGSLELGKLVTASYLHRNWERISTLFKIYFTTAVLILIFITSMGIFGYLSNAYQKTALGVENIESKVSILEDKKIGIETDVIRFTNRIEVLTEQRTSQETRYDSLVAGENWVNAGRTYELIKSADEEIKSLSEQVTSKREEIQLINEEIYDINQSAMELSKDIGGFKFIAEAFDLPIEQVVKWFIIIIIFVFDPLAVSLVVAFNALDEKSDNTFIEKIEKKDTSKKIEKQINEDELNIDNKSNDLGTVSNSSQTKPNEKRHIS